MATKSVGLTGRDYSTLAAWATYYNALSLSANEICEVYNDGGPVADTAIVSISNTTTNGYSTTIRPASGHGIKDNANRLTNALRWNSSNGAALTSSASYDDSYYISTAGLSIEDLQLRSTHSAGSSVIRFGPAGGTVTRSILWKNSGGFVVKEARNCTIRDSLLVQGNGTGLSVSENNVDIDGCTIVALTAGGRGIRQDYTQAVPPRVRNTAIFGFSTNTEGTFRTGSTNNATSSASWGGTGISGQTSLASTDFESFSSGSEDFRVASGAAKLPGNGAASIGSGYDVVGSARGATTTTVGAWEQASASGTPPGLATETDTALALLGMQLRAVGLATETDTALNLTTTAGLDFHTAPGLIFGDLAGALTGIARQTAVNMVLRVYAVASPGALVVESGTLTTDSNGRLPRYTHASLAAGTSYHCICIRASDGEIVSAKLQAT